MFKAAVYQEGRDEGGWCWEGVVVVKAAGEAAGRRGSVVARVLVRRASCRLEALREYQASTYS